ncbi:hypothetical protein BDP27DRAFT_1428727 [Rhodocollybia butyracea]|uniref:Uncharacterized protein n=1 Tax=Rhodocollybia butyracea TaxID=206335 RepID=A0A9P5PE09_9AGAR|nr:hypothetical protein BDP27DRAFT_1428727 [Rhodocollybia butyracea]
MAEPLKKGADSVKPVTLFSHGANVMHHSDDKSAKVWVVESGKLVQRPFRNTIHFLHSTTSSSNHKQLMGQSPLAKQLLQNFPSSGITLSPHPEFHFSAFHLTNEGWLCSSNSLLLWIPLDYRQTVLLPPLQLVISTAEITILNLKKFVHGFDWVQCYHDGTTL